MILSIINNKTEPTYINEEIFTIKNSDKNKDKASIFFIFMGFKK